MPENELDAPVMQIAGVIDLATINTARALPLSVDDAERAEGLGLYDKMYTNTYIWAATQYLRARLYESGLTISPAFEAPVPGTPASSDVQREFEQSVEIAAFVAHCLDQLDAARNGLLQTLMAMHTWVRHGMAVAEMSYERVRTGPFAGNEQFAAVRALPRRNYRMVIDPYGKMLGAIGIKPGYSVAVHESLIPKPDEHPGWVPIEYLATLIVNPAEGKPTGESMYRGAYAPWRAASMVDPVEIANMYNFAGQSHAVTAPEGGERTSRYRFPDGSVREASMIELVRDILRNLTPGSAVVLPHGVERINFGGADTQAFEQYQARKGREMVMSVLYSARTLMESTRSSQADAGAAQDVADAAVVSARGAVEAMVRQQILRPLVARSFGAEIAARFTPRVSLGKTAVGDMPKILTAMSQAVASGAITEPMLHVLWPRWFGVEYVPEAPARTVGDE